MATGTTEDFKWLMSDTRGATLGERFYETMERINPLLDAPSAEFDADNWERYLETPWNESVDLYDENYDQGHGKYFAYRWSHIEAGNVRIQSFQINRETDVGDNIRRMYKNDNYCLNNVITSVSTTALNFLGFVFIPSTDRL